MSESYRAVLKVWRTETPTTASDGYRSSSTTKLESVTTQPLDVEFTAGSLPELLYKIQGHSALLRKPEDVQLQAAKEAPKKEKS